MLYLAPAYVDAPGYTPGAGQITLKKADGSPLGAAWDNPAGNAPPAPSAPLRFCVYKKSGFDAYGRFFDPTGTLHAVYTCTGRTGSTFTGLAFESGLDQSWAAGDVAAVAVGRGAVTELQAAVTANTAALAGKLTTSDALSELSGSAAAARANLGLGTAATHAAGDFATLGANAFTGAQQVTLGSDGDFFEVVGPEPLSPPYHGFVAKYANVTPTALARANQVVTWGWNVNPATGGPLDTGNVAWYHQLENYYERTDGSVGVEWHLDFVDSVGDIRPIGFTVQLSTRYVEGSSQVDKFSWEDRTGVQKLVYEWPTVFVQGVTYAQQTNNVAWLTQAGAGALATTQAHLIYVDANNVVQVGDLSFKLQLNGTLQGPVNFAFGQGLQVNGSNFFVVDAAGVTTTWSPVGNTYVPIPSGHFLQIVDHAYNTLLRFDESSKHLGFFGASAGQQTGGALTAAGSYGTNEQSMVNTMWSALRAYGLLT
jgi:hypothetical protein